MTAIQANTRSTKIATSIAGSALIGNAVFNTGNHRSEVAGSIAVFYLLWAVIIAPFKYFKHVALWANSDAGSGAKVMHILMPVLSLLYFPFILILLKKYVPIFSAGECLAYAACAHIALAIMTYHVLGAVADDSKMEQQYGFFTASVMHLAWFIVTSILLLGVVASHESKASPVQETEVVVKQITKPEVRKVAIVQSIREPEQVGIVEFSGSAEKNEIQVLDDELNHTWKALVKARNQGIISEGEFNKIRVKQRIWLSALNKCMDDIDCITGMYIEKNQELEIILGKYTNK